MTSLRGEAPLIRVRMQVHEDSEEKITVAKQKIITDNEEQWTIPGSTPSNNVNVVEGATQGMVSGSRTFSLLSRLGLCRTTCLDLGINEEWYTPQGQEPKEEQKLVSVSLEVGSKIFVNLFCLVCM